MSQETKLGPNLAGYSIRVLTLGLAVMIFGLGGLAQDREIANKLQGFDSYMEQVLKDWNTPGIGVGIVINDKLVFAKGIGTTRRSCPLLRRRCARSLRTRNCSPPWPRGCW